MKIKRQTISVDNLDVGDCFLYDSQPYMKVQLAEHIRQSTVSVECAHLASGAVVWLEPNIIVSPVDAEMTIPG